MDSELRSLLNIDVRSLYEETISYEIADRYLTILQTCRCCNHHQIRKPATSIGWDEYPFSCTQESHCDCDCNCRHLSRHICRAANLNIMRDGYEDADQHTQP